VTTAKQFRGAFSKRVATPVLDKTALGMEVLDGRAIIRKGAAQPLAISNDGVAKRM